MKALSSAQFLKQKIEKSGDWFIGMVLGTDEILTPNEKDALAEKCERIILDYLDLEMDKDKLKLCIGKYSPDLSLSPPRIQREQVEQREQREQFEQLEQSKQLAQSARAYQDQQAKPKPWTLESDTLSLFRSKSPVTREPRTARTSSTAPTTTTKKKVVKII